MSFKIKDSTIPVNQLSWRFPGWLSNIKVLCTLLFLGLFSFNAPAQIVINGQSSDWSGKTYNAYSHDANNTNDNQFTQGSKDGDQISGWRWSLGQTNNKGDITNGAAILGTEGGHNILYFAGDRAVNNGDAAIGFWFFKSGVSLNANGTFSGSHTNGDLLIVSHFTQGGGQADIFIYVFQNGALTGPMTSSNAAVNSVAQPIPTGFTYASTSYPIGDFFEGKVDLTALNIPPCFTNFLLETRNSQSITASLQDLTFGSFTTSVDPPDLTYIEPTCTESTFKVRVNNPVAGSTYTLTQLDNNIVTIGPYVSGTLEFTGLHAGQGFSVTRTTAEGCVSRPAVCSSQ
jgi:hypothetical protein